MSNITSKEPKEIKYEVKEHIAILSTSHSGWTKELRLISWGGASPKYDIREWAPDDEKMSKGITLSPSEMGLLVDSFNSHLKNKEKK